MSEIQIQQLIRSVIGPAVLSGGTFFLTSFLPEALRKTIRPVGLAASWSMALILIIGIPSPPLWGSPQGLWLAVVLAAIWPMVDLVAHRRTHYKRYLATALLLIALLKPLIFGGEWAEAQSLIWIVSLTAASTFIWFSADTARMKISTMASLALFIVVGTGASLLILSEGSASLAELTGAYCSALGGVAAIAGLRFTRADGEHLPFAIFSLLALIVGHFFYVEPNPTLWAIALSPLGLLWFRVTYGSVAQSPWQETLVLVAVALVPEGYVIWKSIGILTSGGY